MEFKRWLEAGQYVNPDFKAGQEFGADIKKSLGNWWQNKGDHWKGDLFRKGMAAVNTRQKPWIKQAGQAFVNVGSDAIDKNLGELGRGYTGQGYTGNMSKAQNAGQGSQKPNMDQMIQSGHYKEYPIQVPNTSNKDQMLSAAWNQLLQKVQKDNSFMVPHLNNAAQTGRKPETFTRPEKSQIINGQQQFTFAIPTHPSFMQ